MTSTMDWTRFTNDEVIRTCRSEARTETYWGRRAQEYVNHARAYINGDDLLVLPVEYACDECYGDKNLPNQAQQNWWNWIVKHLNTDEYSDAIWKRWDQFTTAINTYTNSLGGQSMSQCRKMVWVVLESLRIDADEANFSLNTMVYLMINIAV